MSRLLLALTAAFVVTACASSNNARFRMKPEDIEVTTSAEESIEAVEQSPTTFTIKPKDDNAAWSRANFFLTQYTRSKRVTRSEIPGGSRLTAGTAGTDDRYAYEIKKVRDSRGITYSVRCVLKSPPGKIDANSQRNAKNLARFIKTGELELSVLSQ